MFGDVFVHCKFNSTQLKKFMTATRVCRHSAGHDLEADSVPKGQLSEADVSCPPLANEAHKKCKLRMQESSMTRRKSKPESSADSREAYQLHLVMSISAPNFTAVATAVR